MVMHLWPIGWHVRSESLTGTDIAAVAVKGIADFVWLTYGSRTEEAS